MRNIKFRGKSTNTNKWVYGYYSYYKSIAYDEEFHYIRNQKVLDTYVIKDTVGQYTGLHDKNGTEIYEGDIVTNGDENIRYVVEWIDTGLKARQTGNKSYIGLNAWKDTIEVIGNIYDNPELLGE